MMTEKKHNNILWLIEQMETANYVFTQGGRLMIADCMERVHGSASVQSITVVAMVTISKGCLN